MPDENILKLNINGKSYQVEIADLNADPIVVLVNGQEILVRPENVPTQGSNEPKLLLHEDSQSDLEPQQKKLNSPLPGKVIELFAKNGDSVEKGQVILIIEAMKMKNSIRATSSGKISVVHVSAGDTVSHKQLLVEFE